MNRFSSENWKNVFATEDKTFMGQEGDIYDKSHFNHILAELQAVMPIISQAYNSALQFGGDPIGDYDTWRLYLPKAIKMLEWSISHNFDIDEDDIKNINRLIMTSYNELMKLWNLGTQEGFMPHLGYAYKDEYKKAISSLLHISSELRALERVTQQRGLKDLNLGDISNAINQFEEEHEDSQKPDTKYGPRRQGSANSLTKFAENIPTNWEEIYLAKEKQIKDYISRYFPHNKDIDSPMYPDDFYVDLGYKSLKFTCSYAFWFSDKDKKIPMFTMALGSNRSPGISGIQVSLNDFGPEKFKQMLSKATKESPEVWEKATPSSHTEDSYEGILKRLQNIDRENHEDLLDLFDDIKKIPNQEKRQQLLDTLESLAQASKMNRFSSENWKNGQGPNASTHRNG
jgi:hypothetical protein